MAQEKFITSAELLQARKKIDEEIEQTLEQLKKWCDIEIIENNESTMTIAIKYRSNGKERILGFTKIKGVGKMIEEQIQHPKNY
jgi:hypothetical protein